MKIIESIKKDKKSWIIGILLFLIVFSNFFFTASVINMHITTMRFIEDTFYYSDIDSQIQTSLEEELSEEDEDSDETPVVDEHDETRPNTHNEDGSITYIEED